MKKLSKMVLLAALAAAVGMTTMGCDDDTTTSPADLAVSQDLATTTVVHDMAKDHD